ncbi:hypothetical protein [uncultured Maricaulis sp.]|uniref:hypothetical protein n=1 Tax=uncultured Maricaulis sp. TaxID=174710 RepID=UPI0030D89A22|tara:strand:+ start:8703 stop:9161 length:459 start_codon:yes stop_codon:yes gene_type:complete
MIRTALILALALAGGASAQTDRADQTGHAVPQVSPVPDYPFVGARYGMTAICRASHNVSADGRAVDICVTCAIGGFFEPPRSAVSRATRKFTEATEEALEQWRYGEEYWGYRGVQTQFEFALSEASLSRLPRAPVMGECPGSDGAPTGAPQE